MKKRIFAILLALVMLLGALPVTASASGSPGYISNVTLGENRSNGGATLLSQWLTYSSLNVAWPSRSGAMQKKVGDTGLTQMMPQAGNYAAYYGIPAKGSVYSSDTSMIKDCKFELGNYGSTSDPCLNFTYTVAGEGTADITLKYYYSFDGSNWYIGQATFTIYTEGFKPEKPDPPTDDDLNKYYKPAYRDYYGYHPDAAVYFLCQDMSSLAHDASWGRLTWVPGAYSVGEVRANSGYYAENVSQYAQFTKDKYPWVCDVTLDSQKYLDAYNEGMELGFDHYLADGQAKQLNVPFFSDGYNWYCLTGKNVAIWITCAQPTTEDITLSYADEHGDPITGLPNSQTATVTRGEKASFTVAAGPTCDENKHTFASWNTKADGTGTSYAPGATIELSASATLYAQWNGSGSGGGEDDPKTPVGPGEGESESDSGNIDFGDNKITVDCVKNSGHTSLTLPLSKDTIVKNSGTMDTAAGTGSIRIATNYYVNEYVDNAASGRMPHKAKQNEATIPLKWDATKWIVDTEAGIPTIEVECVTTVTPEELAALNIEVNVDCVDENGEDTKAYAVVKDDIENIVILPADDPTAEDPQSARVTFEIKTAGFVAKYNAEGGYNPNHTQVWPLNGGNLKWVAYFNNGVLNDCSGLIEDTHRNDTIEVTHTSVTPPLDNLQVTFDYQAPGEIANENVSVKPGDTVTAPDMTNKTREDYTFGGWYTDSACTDGKEFNFSTPITESMTLNAKWTPKEQKTTYTVHYYLENSTTKVANDRVVSDAKVGEEATETAPTLTGYTCVTPSPQHITPVKDATRNVVTFYYKEDLKIDDIENLLNRNKVTVKCVNETGKHAEGYYAPEGTLTKIAEGYNGHIAYALTAQSATFVGWYSESYGTHTLKEKQPAQLTELTWTVYWDADAEKWAFTNEATRVLEVEHAEKVTVRFDCQVTGMTNPPDQTVTKGEKATAPDMTNAKYERTGYTFEGWYETAACTGEKFNFTTAINADKTLYAKWTPRTDIPYTVKYLEEGTNKELHAAKTGTGTFNTTVQVTAEAISGYTLVGSSPRDLKLENVSNNELIFYYTKDPVKVSYTVHYYLDGTTTKVAADKVVNNVNAGTEVTEDAISVTGYTAAAPTQQKLNLSATGTNEIIFYYTKNVGTQVAYTIRYLKEGTGEALLPAYSGTGVAGNSLTVTAPAIDGYTALAPTSYTITLNAEAAKNIITFYYREATSTIPAGEPAKEPFNKNANPRQFNRDDHFAYIKGYPDGTVRPEASLTRAEAAAILYRVMEKSCVERFHAESSSFRDVPDGKWYTTYVATLEKAGVIVDSKDGNFRPNDAITRAELASMLAQFANVTGGTNTFSDVPATHWAADYIAAAVRSGWIQGYPDGTFRPEQTIKRAEMTAMVNRALGRDPQSASDLLEGMKTWKDNADPTAWFYLDIQEAANGHTYARKTGGEYWTGLVADVVQ